MSSVDTNTGYIRGTVPLQPYRDIGESPPPAGIAGTPILDPVTGRPQYPLGQDYNKAAPKNSAGHYNKAFIKRFHKMYPRTLAYMKPSLNTINMANQEGSAAQLADTSKMLKQYGLEKSDFARQLKGATTNAQTARNRQALVRVYQNAFKQALYGSIPKYETEEAKPYRPGPDWAAIGTQLASAAIGAAIATSDAELKKEIRPVRWKWNKKAEKTFGLKGKATGLLAQDVEKVWPDTVITKQGYKHIVYPAVAARLAHRVQEQGKTIEALTRALGK